jgi:predicted RNA methylase
MTGSRIARQWLLPLMLAAAAALAQAPAPQITEYKPEVGQAGKDVVWVPSPQALVDKMLDMAMLTPADFLMDLGSGDGITVITAAKRGARALGVEYNADMVALSRRNAAAAGVSDRATFIEADIFETDLSRANVITMFLLPDLNLRLRPEILRLKPGTRVVSNSFKMGDWEPEEVVELGCGTYCTAFLWLVPAQVTGTWKSSEGELRLTQIYQKVSGTLSVGNMVALIVGGALRADDIRFFAGAKEYRGKVANGQIKGTVTIGGKSQAFSAQKLDD